VRAVLPFHLSDVDQPDKCLVDQRCCLKGMPSALVRHMAASKAAQFVVDEWNQPFERRFVAGAPVNQQPRDLRWGRSVDHSKRLVHEKRRLG
jgi:hypothetical protein